MSTGDSYGPRGNILKNTKLPQEVWVKKTVENIKINKTCWSMD